MSAASPTSVRLAWAAAAVVATLGLATPSYAQVGGGMIGKDASAGCAEDDLGDHSTVETAESIPASFSRGGLVICPGVDDVFSVRLLAGQTISVELAFSHALGDIDVELLDAAGEQLDLSEGTEDTESLEYRALGAQTVYIRVYGYEAATNSYSIEVKLHDLSSGCAIDASDGNAPDNALVITDVPRTAGTLCLDDSDWLYLQTRAGTGVELRFELEPSLGPSLPSEVFVDGRLVTARIDRLSPVRIPAASRPRHVYVRMASTSRSFGAFNVLAVPIRDAWARSGRAIGTVTFAKRLESGADLKGTEASAASGVLVEIVRDDDGAVIASERTDERGEYELAFDDQTASFLRMRVSADGALGEDRVRVRATSEEDAVSSLITSPLSSTWDASRAAYVSDFHFPADAPLGGAFNIVDTVRRGYAFLRRFTDEEPLDLTVVWQRGRPHACTSCYANDVIYLGGGFDDPDEFDDSIILHEMGHFVVDRLSHDDSPGGNHDGARTDPLVAFGEGIATVFSMLVRDSPFYLDTMISGGLYQDFERAPFPEAYGTSDGTVRGLISEYLIAAAIWDQYDPVADPSVERSDRLALGAEGIMEVLLRWLPQVDERSDYGVEGTDFSDWLAGAACLFPESAAEVYSNAVEQHRFPPGLRSKVQCAHKPPAPVLIADDGALRLRRGGHVRAVEADASSASWGLCAEAGPLELPVGTLHLAIDDAEGGHWGLQLR